MKRIPHIILAASFWLMPGIAGSVDEEGKGEGKKGKGRLTKDVDFRNDVMPVFTKIGCNAGACHGAAIGRGGFKLSLYGSDPSADYRTIVRELEGRRVNLARPEDSLILLKPTHAVPHGGGLRLEETGEGAKLLRRWIAQGAKYQSPRALKSVEVTPLRYVAERVGSEDFAHSTVQLRASAHFSDGSSRDVTPWTVFTAEDASAVDVDRDSARATVLRRGRHIVVARYLTEVMPIELIVPLNDGKVDLSGAPRRNFIDEEILDALTTLRLSPSPSADDAGFLRRVALDLTGRLPTTREVRVLLANDDVSKRPKLVDKLLESEAFNEYWTLQLAKLLRIRPQRNDAQGATAYHQWLSKQIRSHVGYDEIARSLLTATGDTHAVGPANFYRTAPDAKQQAELMSELFMGTRLRCANCHNHPLDRWTQDDYHGLAAIFAKIESGKIVTEKPGGKVIHPSTLEPAVPKIPGLDVAWSETMPQQKTEVGRQQLAEWLTDSANPYFAKAAVNRLWKHMMGRGLVEPVDDFRATNPATHPALLDKLAKDFVANGYSIRHTLGVIANSTAYARSSDALEQNKDDDRFYSHAIRKPLEPEVLADAISDVLGVAGKYGDEPEGARAVALVNPNTPSRTLDILGRCNREESCEGSQQGVDGLSQMLHLFNGDSLNARLAPDGSRLNRFLSAGTPPLEVVREFYLVALSRRPTAKEEQFWKTQLEPLSSIEEQTAFLEDFVWGLLTSSEFITNH